MRSLFDTVARIAHRQHGRIMREAWTPPPRTNIDRRGDKVDCHWPQLDLTVELLSYRFHATRQAFERDVARRRRSGHVAYTYGDVFGRGAATVADLRPRLAVPTPRAARPPPSPAPPC